MLVASPIGVVAGDVGAAAAGGSHGDGLGGAGKSNLVKALRWAQELVIRGTEPDKPIARVPFRLDEESRAQPTLFEVRFLALEQVFQYGFLVDSQRGGKMTASQLVFTTHETHLLDLDLMRRDGIWFVEKDQEGASTLYSLADFKPRKDLRIEKGYLQGRFGAIPFLGGIDRLMEKGQEPEQRGK